jgi:hypothetical protein
MKLDNYYNIKSSMAEAVEKVMLDEIVKAFAKNVKEVKKVFAKIQSESVLVYYEIEIDGIISQEECYISYDDDVFEACENASRHITCIKDLRKQYPQFCAINDYLQKNRIYKKEIKLDDGYYGKVFNIQPELTKYLKLPSTTSCSVGGGDYEIKRTPERVKIFEQNLNALTKFFKECISEIEILKAGLENIKEEKPS